MDPQLRQALGLFYSDHTPPNKKTELNQQLQNFASLEGAWRTCLDTLSGLISNQNDVSIATLEQEIMYYLSVIEHHIRFYWWNEAKISGSDHKVIQHKMLETFAKFIEKRYKQSQTATESIAELPCYLVSKLSSTLAAVHVIDLGNFMHTQLQHLLDAPQFRVYGYFVIKAVAQDLTNPMVKLPSTKLLEIKKIFFNMVQTGLFDQTLMELVKIKNNPELIGSSIAGISNKDLNNIESLAEIYISTIGAICTICPTDVCFRPSLVGFVDFILEESTSTKNSVSGMQVLEELLSKQDVSSSQYAVLEMYWVQKKLLKTFKYLNYCLFLGSSVVP